LQETLTLPKMNYRLTETTLFENAFPDYRNLDFDALDQKIRAAEQTFGARYVSSAGDSNIHEEMSHTIMNEKYYTPRVAEIFEEMKAEHGVSDLHVYCSYQQDAGTIGKHKDYDDVLLIQSVGGMEYLIDGETYFIKEGDALFIPKGTYHTPKVISQRITLSFAWVDVPKYETN
jgi:mannose-6-phosphate isomerase-like protein (cupin superfamily)